MSAGRLVAVASLLPLLALVACGGETSRTDERGPDGTTHQDPQTNTPKPPTAKPASLCGDRQAQAQPFGIVTLAAQRTARNGCGDVAFVDATGDVWVKRIEMAAPTKVGSVPADKVGGTKLAVSPTGKYLAYSADDGAHQVALDVREAETVYPLLPLDDLGFLLRRAKGDAPAADVLALCGKSGGLRLAGAAVSTESAGCDRLVAEGGPYAAARRGAQQTDPVLVLDARDGKARELTALSSDLTAADPMMGDPHGLSFSPDGRTLFFERRSGKSGGDAFYFTDLAVRAVDLDNDQIGPSILVQKGMIGSQTTIASYFVPPGPHRVAVAAPSATFFIDQAGVTHELPRKGLRTIDPTGTDGVFLDTSGKIAVLARAPLAGGAETVLSQGVEAVRGTDDLSRIIVAKIPTDGIRYPDNPGVSHAQLWNTTRVDALGETTIATSTQPLKPVWVGEDGATLLRGGLARAPLPAVAAPADVPPEVYGFHAVDGAGTHIGTVTDESTQTLTTTKRGVLLDGFQVNQGFRFVFVSGRAQRTELAPDGASKLGSVQERFVDATGEIAVVTGPGNGTVATRIVLAGALPR